MKIVEYNHNYAQQVADMWNKSSSNWGNDEIFKAKEDIINTESSSGNIKLYLALDNDQVVGYCSFSEYQHDEGASYLPLLNVIPEYHGKKVGKQLILTVLKDAIKSKWSRFDLFTWSGNIKAMPLYKKCGFFWERKNDTVHLMNFLPYIFQTEALTDYLELIDTYSDNKRPIDMEQDGRTENGFDFYRYEFINDDIKLFMDFEKSGRGLTYLDTPDYTIKMNVQNHELVYNNIYDVSFDIVNKTENPLDIKVTGKKNKNIECNINTDEKISTTETITGQFVVNPIDKDQDTFRTHPVVEAEIYINGKVVTFKMGIEPKHPIKVKLVTNKYSHVLNKEYTAYLNVENNLPTEEEFTFSLPSNFVTFEENIKRTLKPKEKRSIKVKYKLNDYGFYREEATVTYNEYSSKTLVYTVFKGATSSFIGKTDYVYYMVSGNYIAYVNTKSGNAALKCDFGGNAVNAFMTAQLGKPYNLEFSTQEPVVEVINDNELTTTYTSKAFEGVKLVRHYKHIYGVLETKYEIVNTGKDRELSLTIPVWQGTMNTYLPYKGKLLYLDMNDESSSESFDMNLVDENWIYNKKEKYGFAWEDGLKIKVSEWKFAFDVEDVTILENESYTTPSFFTSMVHSSVKSFREFRGYLEEREEMTYLDILVNNGNPFSDSGVEVKVINHKKAPLKGTLVVNDKETDINESIELPIGFLDITLKSADKEMSYKRLTFESKGDISKTMDEDSHIVNNGLLTFKASKEYADSIYSLVFNDNEYLDSNYPTPKERSWWGDFVGGLTQRVNGIQDISALKEERDVTFIELQDNFGNIWEGIKVSLRIVKDPDLKGLVIDTYTVTLPHTPVVYSFSNIKNNTGMLLEKKEFYKFNVLRIDEDKKSVTFNKKDITYKCNDIGLEIDMEHFIQINSNQEYSLAVYNPKHELEMDTQKNHNILFSHAKITILDQEEKQIKGDFFVFTKEDLKEEYISDLKNIKFEV